MKRLWQYLALLVVVLAPFEAAAHSLGIDRAELVETNPGEYRLISKVPPRIAPAVRTPDLPEQCSLTGNPAGERGSYSVAFTFACQPALTAGDQLVLPWQREGALLTVTWHGQEPVTRLAGREGAAIVVPLGDWLAATGSTFAASKRYFVLGVEHILAGLDHLLFVLCLLFVVDGRWKLIKTITAFTLAHSITLALATFGYISLPSSPVESAIALSIVFLASEIIRKARGARSLTFDYPWLVAFAFGLLHGLGFAGALSEIGLAPQEVPVALLFFNIGVEVGQLLFVAAILAVAAAAGRVLGSERHSGMAQTAVVYLIGSIAMYWFIERSVGLVS